PVTLERSLRTIFGGKDPDMRTQFLIALGLGITCLSAGVRGDEWPQFRGPGSTGLTSEKQLPLEWSTDKNLQWKVKVPGRGWSSPIIWGDKVFLTTASSDEDAKLRAAGGQRGGRPGGFGGPGGGGPGGFGGPPQPGQLLPSFLQERLKLAAEQK